MRIIALDFDGILCKNRKGPEVENIVKVRKLAEDRINFIVIHTARPHSYYGVLVEWLNLYGVPYHAVHMGKMPADIYIDDKNGDL